MNHFYCLDGGDMGCVVYSGSRGLLGIVQELHERNDKAALMIIHFILKVALEHPPVLEYLLKRKLSLQWIREYLESKIEDLEEV
jgi:hypothetical protein